VYMATTPSCERYIHTSDTQHPRLSIINHLTGGPPALFQKFYILV
jgi:hypothetical protein